MSTPALVLDNVGVTYRGLRAVEGVSLTLAQTEMLGIAGPNGAGKTSLLRAIAGLVPLAGGRVTFNGEVIADASARRRRSVRQIVRGGMCLVPEGRRLFAGLTVEDHLKFGAYLVGIVDVAGDLERVYRIFPKLKERRRQDVTTLSGGEKQMVAIARALMARPKLLMIDELSLGLAPVIVNELIDALRTLNTAAGMTIMLVDECLGPLGTAVSRVLFLAHGRAQAIRSPDEMRKDGAALYLAHQD
ncbi:MAG: ATP-binding cassette domain-containing protein [Hyphomicrobiales bacterium]|nr:ATP-binding cassette domain-containing protein [Hyphomicrobiales bacterium]